MGTTTGEVRTLTTSARPDHGQRDRTYGGRYRAERTLRSGADGGQTVLGVDLHDGSPVVIRLLAVLDTAASRDRVERELAALARLAAAPLLDVLAAGREDGTLWYVTPFVPGVTLEERLADGPLPLADALAVGRSLLRSLAEAHGRGLLHRDVRPSNVVLEPAAPVTGCQLVDFGVAALARAGGAVPDAQLRTARYASPEAAGLLDHGVDERSDLYSAGAVVFECLAGQPPFQGDTVGEVLRQHLNEPAPPLRSLGVAVPRVLDEVVQRLLMKEPADRYTSAAAVLADLDDIATAIEAGRAEPDLVVGARDLRRTVTSPAFVGRTVELAAIEAEVRTAWGGKGGLVLVEAESGGGKTRLLEELAQRSAERGVWVLRGQGVDQAARRPLQVLDGVVDGVIGRARHDTAFVDIVRQRMGEALRPMFDALPRLLGTLGSAETGSLGPEAYGEARSLPALTAFLDALGAAGRPALVVLDDCQWADELTVKLLAQWSARTARAGERRVVVVAAFRSEEVPADDPFRRMRPSGHVELPAFGDQDLRRVLLSMAGPLPDEAVAVVGGLSEGNPFMATAVLRGLVETGALVEEAGTWQVAPDAMADVQTSRHAAAFLARRLEMLPAPARHLLSVGAVLGKEFDAGLATSLSRQTRPQVTAAIDEARRRHILWTHGATCVFVHDKLREALLDQLPPEGRRRLHRRAGLALEGLAPDRVFELAYHFDAAADWERALPYALEAADLARGQHALEVAERQYRIAAKGTASAGPELRKRVAEGLGDVLMLRGHYEAAEAELRAAGELAETDVERAGIEGKLGELAFKRGDVTTASEAVERAVRLLGRRMPRGDAGFLVSALWEILVQALHTVLPRLFLGRRTTEEAGAELLAVRLYSRLAYVYWFQRGRIPCLWAHLREMNLAERYPPTAELAQAYSEHAPVMTMVPWNSRGMAYAQRSLQIRTDLGDVWGQGQSLHFIGVVHYADSRYRDCIETCRRAAHLLDRTGDCWESNTAKWHLAFALYRLGDLAAAVEASRAVRAGAVAIGDHQAAAIALGAWSKASAGRVPAALVAEELETVGEDVHTGAEVLQAEAVRLLSEDRPGQAARLLERAAGMVKEKGLKQEYVAPIQPWLATALRQEALAAPPWAHDRRRRLLRQARRASRRALRLSRSYRNNLPHACREAALLAAIGGREGAARRHFSRSLTVAEAQRARYERAQTLLASAQVGMELGWPGSAEAEVEARRSLADLTGPLAPHGGEEVTLSLLDRLDSLLQGGQQIASALTAEAVYGAVRDAGVTLLRAEACRVLELDHRTDGADGAEGAPYDADLVARALATGRPAVLEGLEGDHHGHGRAGPVRSAMCAPIFIRGRAVACAYLTHAQVGALFGEEEVRLAEFIATLAGAALENAEGFAEVQALSRSLEKRVDERTTELAEANRLLTERSEAVALLRTIAVATNEASTVEDALQVALDEVCRHTGWPVGHVCLVSEDVVSEVVPTAIWHLDDPAGFDRFRRVSEATSFVLGVGLPGRVAGVAEPAWIDDVTADHNFPRGRAGQGLGVRAGFAVPMLAGQEVVGVLEFFSPAPAPPDPPLLELVAQVGTELGRVVERKRAEDALRHSDGRTRAILEAANDAFLGMGEDGLITDWNRSAEAIFGWTREEALGRSLADTIIPKAFRQAHRDGLDRFLDTGEGPVLGKRLEMSALHRDGREFPAELSIWRSGTRRPSFNAFVRDITERKKTEQALAVARDQAMEASRLKSQFLATMSHEIRTPMNGVIGLAGLLLDTELGPEQQTYAEGVRTAGEALLGVINDVLDFSKIEAGKLELEEVEFDPHTLVDDVVALVAETCHAKGLEIVGACSPDLPELVRGDPGRLRQVLVNLASNAVKFTEHGEVVVRAERLGEPAGDWLTVRFEVSDTGIGIDAQEQAHIFEPFSQADASTTRRYGGTGLGLAISRQLTEAMGGNLELRSMPGHGSTFGVTVPLGRQWSAERPASTIPELAGLRVLVVDDNAAAGDALATRLASWGMQVEVAGDGPTGLARLEEASAVGAPFDLALVDVSMPEMTGVELAGRISEWPGASATRLVLLAARRPLDAPTLGRLGVAECLVKPVREGHLRDALVQVVAPPPAPEPGLPAPFPRPRSGRVPAHTGDRGRVLVVEDNPTNQMVATGLLAKLGYQADVVSNGFDAVNAVERTPYTAVLMDCHMPGMDGYEATAVIRRLEGGARHIPIVAMTAGALTEDRDACLAAGMDDYVAKPVKPGELERVLSGATSARGPDPEQTDRAAVPGGEGDGAALDPTQLGVLRTLDGGDGRFIATLVETYLASAPGSLARLRHAVDRGDRPALEQEAHRFKGESATVGATALAEMCEELGALGPPADAERAVEAIGRAEAELARVRRALLALVDGAPAAGAA